MWRSLGIIDIIFVDVFHQSIIKLRYNWKDHLIYPTGNQPCSLIDCAQDVPLHRAPGHLHRHPLLAPRGESSPPAAIPGGAYGAARANPPVFRTPSSPHGCPDGGRRYIMDRWAIWWDVLLTPGLCGWHLCDVRQSPRILLDAFLMMLYGVRKSFFFSHQALGFMMFCCRYFNVLAWTFG